MESTKEEAKKLTKEEELANKEEDSGDEDEGTAATATDAVSIYLSLTMIRIKRRKRKRRTKRSPQLLREGLRPPSKPRLIRSN